MNMYRHCFVLLLLGRGVSSFSMTSIPSVSRSAKYHQSTSHVSRSSASLFKRRRIHSPAASTSLYSSATEDDAKSTIFHQLHGKTLVSIEDCMEAELQQRQLLTQDDRPSPKVVFIDGSWYHKPDPVTNIHRNPAREFQVGPRLPNSRYLDIDAIATTYELFPDDNPKRLPHMMPPAKLFGLAMDAYGIGNNETNNDDNIESDHVVIYARRGAVFTPRTWFLFVSMGHDPNKVHLMQGSIEDWIEKGGSVDDGSLLGENEQSSNTIGDGFDDCFNEGILDVKRLYTSRYDNEPIYRTNVATAKHICDKDEVLDAVNRHLEKENNSDGTSNNESTNTNSSDDGFTKTVIIDTRGSGYSKKGYMPSAIHFPYQKLVTPSNKLVFQPKEVLHKLWEEKGIDYLDSKLKIIFSCGSGVSVCHGYLSLKELGREITEENTRVYDGSWKEWGRMEEDLPRILPGDVVDGIEE